MTRSLKQAKRQYYKEYQRYRRMIRSRLMMGDLLLEDLDSRNLQQPDKFRRIRAITAVFFVANVPNDKALCISLLYRQINLTKKRFPRSWCQICGITIPSGIYCVLCETIIDDYQGEDA
jgi:hypothetical protein